MPLRRRLRPRPTEPVPEAPGTEPAPVDLAQFRRSARELADDVAEAERRLEELGERLRGIDERATEATQRT